MPNERFQNFLTQMKQSESAGTQNARMELWRGKLTELYALIDSMLAGYVDAGEVRTQRETRTIYEELVGSYDVDAYIVSVRGRRVSLEPIGTFIFGAYGRVDLKGPTGFKRLVLVERDSKGAKVQVTVGKGAPLAERPVDAQELEWKFATPPPRIAYERLDEETFTSALVELLGA